MVPAVRRFLFGEMREHLDTKAAVQVVADPLPPRTPYDLGGKAPGRAWLRHDVIGKLPGPLEKLGGRYNLVDHPIFQRRLGVDRLARQQRVGGSLDSQQLLRAAVNTIPGTEPLS